MNVITSLRDYFGNDTPGCDTGIYRATVIPLASVHPADLMMIVDDPAWHEIQARAAVPYSTIFPGVNQPDTIDRADKLVSSSELQIGTPFGLLGAASIIDRETAPVGGKIKFISTKQFNAQGTDTIAYADSDLCGVRILGVMPNRSRTTFDEISNLAGERVSIIGEVSTRNYDSSGNLVTLADGSPDTSFLVRMPANVPYLMQAIDCNGRTLNTDQTWQHLRPGEQKTCGGCHVHSKPPKNQFDETFASTSNYLVAHFGEGTVPLLNGATGSGVAPSIVQKPGYGLHITMDDVLPIFQSHCVSCHSSASPAGNLALDVPGRDGLASLPAGIKIVSNPSTWWCLVGDLRQVCVPSAQRHVMMLNGNTTTGFNRPQVTRYVRAFNSLGSLLYWKAAGKRTDNKLDSDDSVDIDFGPAHDFAPSITAEELGMISRWIDIGAAGGPMEKKDTQKPTLHVSAIIAGGASVTELRVGTIDLGSGIAPATLEVCILGTTGQCTDISGDAVPHGIVKVPVSGLSDPDTEILARVEDVAGNMTEVRRTIGWLLSAPPPPPPAAPRPTGGTGGGTGPGGTGSGNAAIGGGGCNVAHRSQRGGLVAGLFFMLGMTYVVRRRRRRSRS